jgi:hypothetical protein
MVLMGSQEGWQLGFNVLRIFQKPRMTAIYSKYGGGDGELCSLKRRGIALGGISFVAVIVTTSTSLGQISPA